MMMMMEVCLPRTLATERLARSCALWTPPRLASWTARLSLRDVCVCSLSLECQGGEGSFRLVCISRVVSVCSVERQDTAFEAVWPVTCAALRAARRSRPALRPTQYVIAWFLRTHNL